MSYFNQNFYKKSYILEFSDKTSIDIDAIAFSLPPQSEEFTFPQRIGETKTFGGAVIEDYGNDLSKIVLSGSSVNSELRIIYKGSRGVSVVNGESEIFEIKNKIDEYGKLSKLGKKVILYSLDSPASKNNKSFNVVINEFSVKRSKENPLAYNYTLTCTGIPENRKNNNFAAWLEEFQNKINTACDDILSKVEILENALSYYRAGLDFIAILKDTVIRYEETSQAYINILSGAVDITADYIYETLALGDTVIKSAQRLTLGAGINVFTSAKEVSNAAHELAVYFRDFDEKNISSDLIEAYQATAEDIHNTWVLVGQMIEDDGNLIEAETKKQCNSMDYTIEPGDTGVNDTIRKVYGYTTTVIKDTDTWDGLAARYYGDPNLGLALAIYNGSNDKAAKLEAGYKVSLPIYSRSDSNDGSNLVYSSPDNRDNYGTDIEIKNDDISIYMNDFVQISGTENLAQAINCRLQTALDSRIRNTVYGIRASIGTAADADSYLLTSIYNTVLEDPRIKSIESLKYRGVGDNVYVELVYKDINNDIQSYGGLI